MSNAPWRWSGDSGYRQAGGVVIAGQVALGAHQAADPVRATGDQQARILAVVRARQRTAVDAIVRELHRRLPAMWRMRTPSLDAELRLALHTLIGMFVSAAEDERAVSSEELAAVRSIGARRAREGIPVDLLLAAVRVAGEVGWDELVRAAQALPPSPQTVVALGRLGPQLVSFLDETNRSLRDAYRAGEDDGDARSALVAEVLSGPPVVEELEAALVDRGRAVGVDLAGGWSVVLVTRAAAQEDWSGVREAAARLLQRPGALAVPVTVAFSVHTAMLLPAAGARGYREHLQAARAAVAAHPAVILACTPVRGPRALRTQYVRAAQLLGMVPRVELVPGVYETTDLRLQSLLVSGSADHEDYMRETLGPILLLPEAGRRSLLDTVRALAVAPVSGGNRAVALAGGVHEKTVRRRLDRIRELTGLDPDHPAHRTQLLLAHRLLELSGMAPAAATGDEVELRGERALQVRSTPA